MIMDVLFVREALDFYLMDLARKVQYKDASYMLLMVSVRSAKNLSILNLQQDFVSLLVV